MLNDSLAAKAVIGASSLNLFFSPNSGHSITPTSTVAESDGFLCDNRAVVSNTKKRRFWQSAGCSC